MIDVMRAKDAKLLNAVVNDPSVYPWVHGAIEGYLDLAPVLNNPNNYVLEGKFGAIVFARHSPGIYEAHTQILPAGRGKWAVDFAWAAAAWQFTHTDAVEIWTRCPKGNLGARALARAMGAKLQFRAERGWIVDGQMVYADIFSMTIQDWINTAPGLSEIGHAFHEHLNAEYRMCGREEPSHPDDPTHDRYVGAACEMFRNGQPVKGEIFYNRFAYMANYQPIRLLRVDPVMIDIRDSVLELHGRNFFVAAMGEK